MEKTSQKYILGHSHRELERITFQAKLLNPITHRMLNACGIKQGMQVLDLGCGSGEVSQLAAELVGPTGSVVGIEQNKDALALAQRHASENMTFINGDFQEIDLDQKFDLVIGRAVLIFQKDVNLFLKKAANLVKAGGMLAFHEIDDACYPIHSNSTKLWNKTVTEILLRLKKTCPQYDIAHRFVKEFANAGLDVPALSYEIPTEGGEAKNLCFWAVETLVSLSNECENIIFSDGTEMNSNKLLMLLHDEIRTSETQVQFLGQACAWVKIK